MNRPHFPIGRRSGADFYGRHDQGTSAFSMNQNLGDTGRAQPTAIENLRRLMSDRSPITEGQIADLRDRVARGDFLTREAAEATASRLVDDGIDLD